MRQTDLPARGFGPEIRMLAKESRETGTPTQTEGVTVSTQNPRAPLMRTAVTEPAGLAVRGIPVPSLAGFLSSERLDAGAKRLIDIVVSLVLLVVLAPMILLVAVLVRLDSRGPAFFQVSRVGHGSRELLMLKFRKMHADATGIALTTAGDARLTRLGAFLAKSKLDEIPQLWHVLRGDLSLVGPRPEQPQIVHHLQQRIEFYSARHCVRPGITGWAQVNHGYAGSVEDTIEKLQYEFFYIKRQSLAFDVVILLATVRTILSGGGQ